MWKFLFFLTNRTKFYLIKMNPSAKRAREKKELRIKVLAGVPGCLNG